MGRVNVDKDSLLTIIKQLEQYESDLEAARVSLNNKYKHLGSSWNDRKYQELGDIVNECNSALRTVQKTALLGEKSIAALIKAIQEYEETNIGSSGSSSGNSMTRHLSADDVNNQYMARINDTDAMIENYREALMARGVPQGEWLERTLSQQRSRMLDQEGRTLDAASGGAGGSDNTSGIYQYPGDYSAFYDELANEYRQYCASQSSATDHSDSMAGNSNSMYGSSDNIDASEMIRNYGESFTASLDAQEQSSIRKYTGVSYANINATLRGLESRFDEGNYENTLRIHSALQRAELPCDCTVYRGVSSSALGELAALSDQQLIGQDFIDPGFLSTSLDPSAAFCKDVLLEIHAPAGSHGMYVGSISSAGRYEEEVLFDYNQNMQINSVRRDNFGRRVIEVTLI